MELPFGVSLLLLALMGCLKTTVHAQSYEDAYNLEEILFRNYSTTIRPLSDQSQKIRIWAGFDVVTISSVDEIQQQFTVNGFLMLLWVDERLQWDPAAHSGIERIKPNPITMWRPRLILINTMEDRDLLEDDYAPLIVYHNGTVEWFPGGLFPATCAMDLRKFPLDEHTCGLVFLAMSMNTIDVHFISACDAVLQSFFEENGEWKMEKSNVSAYVGTSQSDLPFLSITLTVTRKPQFFIINILLPVVILGVLNMLVFAIPVDSGEKISYSISVLLAFSIYTGVVNTFLPTNSENMPYLIVYIFLLFLLSVLCCVDTIFIVYLHHKEEEDEKRQKRDTKLTNARSKLGIINFMRKRSDKHKQLDQDDDSNSPSTPQRSPVVSMDRFQTEREEDVNRMSTPGTFHSQGAHSSFETCLTKFRSNRITTVAPNTEDSFQTKTNTPTVKTKRINRNLAEKVNKISFVFFILISIIMSTLFLVLIIS